MIKHYKKLKNKFSFSILALSMIAFSVRATPPPPGIIHGPDDACRGASGIVFCVDPTPGVIDYVWTLPNGVVGTSNNPCITVDFTSKFSGGDICVKLDLGPAGFIDYCKPISYVSSKPAKPAAINGPNLVCGPSIVTYCVDPIPNADGYVWVISGSTLAPMSILSGQGTNCINVEIPNGYYGKQKIKVRAINCKGLSDEKSMEIKPMPPLPAPSSITGPTYACKSTPGTYTCSAVAGATQYLWAVSGYAMIVSGQGTQTIDVDFSGSWSYVEVAVVAMQDCNMGKVKTLNVMVNPNCKVRNTDNAGDEGTYSLYPNPASDRTTVSFYSSTTSSALIQVTDISGRVAYTESVATKEGQQKHELNLSDLSQGMYLVNIIQDEQHLRTMRLVVK